MGRKLYGIELYRSGYAPRLLLSVGRFEVSKMRNIGFAASDALESLRNQSPPEERHFFIWMDSAGLRMERANLRRWSTYGEALGLREFLGKENVRSVLVISSAVHLRRVALTFARVFRGWTIQFSFCPAPAKLDLLEKEGWWLRPLDRSLVLSESIKLAGYWLMLHLPTWAIHRLIRLKG